MSKKDISLDTMYERLDKLTTEEISEVKIALRAAKTKRSAKVKETIDFVIEFIGSIEVEKK